MKIHEGCVWMLGEIMIQYGWLRWDQLDSALAIQKENNRLVGIILVESGVVSRERLYRALAIQHGMKFVDIRQFSIPPQIVQAVPKRLAYEHRIMPLVRNESFLIIAVQEPGKLWPEGEIKKIAQIQDVRAVLSFPEAVDETIRQYYGPEGIAV